MLVALPTDYCLLSYHSNKMSKVDQDDDFANLALALQWKIFLVPN